jgi:hypothetical protein
VLAFGVIGLSSVGGGHAERPRRGPGRAGSGRSLLLPFEFDAVATADVARLFGDDVAGALTALEPGRPGPIASGYGAHTVLVRQSILGSVPALEEVRDAVRRERQSKARRDANEAFCRRPVRCRGTTRTVRRRTSSL